MGQKPSQGVDDCMRGVLRAGTQMEHGKNLGARVDRQPQKDAPEWRSAAWFAVHPVGGVGAADDRRSVRARTERVRQHGTERLVMVACRKPKTRSAAEGEVDPFS
jgi:hypothetical protein